MGRTPLIIIPLMIIQLRIRPKVAPAPALGHGALDVPREPLPRVVQVQDVLAAEAEGGKSRGDADVRVGRGLGPVGARDADDLEAHDAARQVTAAVGAADARADVGGRERVRAGLLLLPLARRQQARPYSRPRAPPSSSSSAGCLRELVLGVAVHAPQGDLARRRRDGGHAAPLALLGAFDFELGPLHEGLVALEVGSVRVAPRATSVVVDVPRRAYG